MRQFLPLLLLLACPLMMVFMMRGMHGHGSHEKGGSPEAPDKQHLHAGASAGADELRQLRDEIDTRLQVMDARIEELKGAEDAQRQTVRT
jgi:hypothetical protein